MKIKRIVMASLLAWCIAAPARSEPVCITVGPVFWYAWWNPMFEKKVFNMLRLGDIFNLKMKLKNRFTMSGSYLAGPALSVNFLKKWSVSAVFTCGNLYRAVSSQLEFYPGSGLLYAVNDDMTIIKYDLDATINYSFTRHVKIFIGMKYQGYEYEGTGTSIDYYGIDIKGRKNSYTLKSNAYGPGAGIGLSIPLVQTLYLHGNLSGIYLNSIIKWTQHWHAFQLAPSFFYDDFNKCDTMLRFHVGGFNANLSFAYYIPAASTSIIIGGRFQYLKNISQRVRNDFFHINPTKPDYNPAGLELVSYIIERQYKKDYNRSTDMFYGLTFSVVYSITVE